MSAPIRLQLRVAPRSTRSTVVGRHGDGWKVRLAAPPEDGRANDALVALLAHTLELPRAAVAILAGHSGRDKIVSLAGIEPAELERRLALAADARPRTRS